MKQLAINFSGYCQICKQQADHVTKLMVSPILLSPLSMDVTGLHFNFITCEKQKAVRKAVRIIIPLYQERLNMLAILYNSLDTCLRVSPT